MAASQQVSEDLDYREGPRQREHKVQVLGGSVLSPGNSSVRQASQESIGCARKNMPASAPKVSESPEPENVLAYMAQGLCRHACVKELEMGRLSSMIYVIM